MFPRFFRPLLALLTLVLALSLTAAPAQALAFYTGEAERPRVRQVKREWSLFSFLVSLFGKSRGGMDPNGTAPIGEE